MQPNRCNCGKVKSSTIEGRPGPWAKPVALMKAGESTVSDESTVVAWAVLSLLLFALDRRRQRRARERSASR